MEFTKEFFHTGIKHVSNDSHDLVTLDQVDYADAIKPISMAQLHKLNDDGSLDEVHTACFLTLLGAVAWLVQTRLDIVVYVSALQRHSHAPLAIHLKRLNRLVRYIQKNPQKLYYRPLPLPVRLIAVGGSAYQAPSDLSGRCTVGVTDPLVMRGYLIALAHYEEDTKTYQLQILEYVAGKQNHVCRGVWSAELFNQCDMVSMSKILLGFLEEVKRGSFSATEHRRLTSRRRRLCRSASSLHRQLQHLELSQSTARHTTS